MYSCDRGVCVITVMLVIDVDDHDCHDDSHETSK